MSKPLSDRKLAHTLAKRYAPIIYQSIKSQKDFIMPFMYGTDERAEQVICANITDRCVLYFNVREDKTYWYCYYLVYHPFDWTSSTSKLMQKWDSHRHDTESILFRVRKKDESIDSVTVAHYLFHFEKNHNNRKVSIEAESHAIHVYKKHPAGGNVMVYKVFELKDLQLFTKKQWEELKKELKGNASLPQEQYDSIFRSGFSGRRFNKKGDIYNRPEQLFKAAKMKGRL